MATKTGKKKITKFKSGAVRDLQGDKENYPECLSFLVLRRFALYMKKASAEYGENNWRKGIPITSYEKSLLRHLQKYFAAKYDGVEFEPGIDHLSAAMFNLQGLMHEQERERMK
jgi:hypothetical protein